MGMSRIPPVDPERERRPYYHGSIQAHLRLLECGRDMLQQMSTDSRIRDSAMPVLFHPDLHKRNIFVSDDDPSIITGIIDWQSTSVEPAFWYVDEVPDFATSVEPDNGLCAKAFEICSQFLTPKLYGPRAMDDNLFRPFRYSYRTWKDGAVAFRHELIETALNWKELGFVGPCPYPMPTPKELAVHQKEYKFFEAAQNLRYDLSKLLNTASDGWVPPQNWETTESAHRELFDGMLQAVLTDENRDSDEPIKDERDLRSIWPFDLTD
jgi:Phosphotransferase enzyme family